MAKKTTWKDGWRDEAMGVVVLFAGAFIALALLSYDSGDASANVASPRAETANLIGRSGAWLADLLYQTLGLPALLLPVPLLIVGYRLLRRRPWMKSHLGRAFSAAVFVIALCTLLALLADHLPRPAGFVVGGVTGTLIAGVLLAFLNVVGSLLVVSAILTLSLMASTRFSPAAGLARLAPFSPHSWWPRRRSDRTSAVGPPLESEPLALPGRARRAQAQDAARDTRPMAETPDQDRPEVRLEPEFAASLQGQDEGELTLVPEMLEAERRLQLPSLDMLSLPNQAADIDKDRLYVKADQLTDKYAEFKVSGKVTQIHPGPVVTTFEFKPDPGVKYSKVISLEQDLCLGLKAESVRIDRIPGKNTVGVEVPNDSRQIIFLREILAAAPFYESESPLTLALGKRINGNTHVADLAKMPHILIAGSTGSGKSVALNCMVCSILYKAQPSEVRFIMIDPKRLELGLYEDIPHLLTPIVTDPKQASNALGWAVREMEQRYKLLARHGVRNIAQFNTLMKERQQENQAEDDECVPLPYIVVIVDELADLMMTSGKEVEAHLTRLAQMARAIGIHLILATQRPSVDVITGLIKANFPCRMSFRVSSRIDSRTIIDRNGAEQLLGMGDMLFLPPGTSRITRLHGPYLSEKEIATIADSLREQAKPQYQQEILEGPEEDETGLVDVSDLHDDLYDEASRFVVETRKASTSLLQRRFRIGYGRAARLLDIMEHEGLISPPDGSKARQILVAANHFDEVDAF